MEIVVVKDQVKYCSALVKRNSNLLNISLKQTAALESMGTLIKFRYPFYQVEAVIDKIIEEARTGEIGDGKIFGKTCVCVNIFE